MKFKSLKIKLMVWVGGCLLFLAIAIISAAAYLAREKAIASAKVEIGSLSLDQAGQLKTRMNESFSMVNTLRDAISVKVRDQDSSFSRETVNAMLRAMIQLNPEYTGIYTCWEPNAFDGDDAAYAGRPGNDASGRFVPYWVRNEKGEPAVEPLAGYEDASLDAASGMRVGEYYLRPRDSKKECLIDPYLYKVQGKDVLMVSIVSPIVVNGKFYGIAGADLPAAFLQQQADAMTKVHPQLVANVVSNNGKLVGVSGRPQLVGKSLKETNADYETDLKDIQLLKNSVDLDHDTMEALSAVQLGKSETPWGVIVKVPLAHFTAAVWAEVGELISIGLACCLAALILLWLLAGRIVKPIRLTAESLKDIAQGEGDLTMRVAVTSNDEVGQLAHWFNVFVEKIHTIIADVAANANEVASAASEIAASSEQIAAGMQNQSEQTEQVSASIEELSSTVMEVARKTAETAHDAEASSDQARGGGEVVKQTIAGINAIAAVTHETSLAIGELGKRGEQIGEIIAMIDDIADQTNLLALNAAIEAARAGEHGRGFAVVADEVRKLAERTTLATKQVAESIKAIQQGTQTAIGHMNDGSAKVKNGVVLAMSAEQALSEILAGTQNASTRIREIAAATEQQSAASEQIARSIENITSIARQTSEGVGQAANAAAHLSLKSEQLQRIVNQFKL